MIVDLVGGGDAALQALLTTNIDTLWALNERRAYLPAIIYLYVQADALRFGMEYCRTQIDEARTQSDSRAARVGSVDTARDFTAQHTEHRRQLALSTGSGSESESRTHSSHTHVDGTEGGGWVGPGFSTVRDDTSSTAYTATRTTGEETNTGGTERTTFNESTFKHKNVTVHAGVKINSAIGIGTPDGDTDHFDVSYNNALVPMRVGWSNGAVNRYDLHSNLTQGGLTSPFDPASTDQTETAETVNTMLIDDVTTSLTLGNISGGTPNQSERGVETDRNTRNVIGTGGGWIQSSHTSGLTRAASSETHTTSASTSTEVTSLDGDLTSRSDSLDTTHGITTDFGQSNSQMLATVDNLSQLFANLKTMLASVLSQISDYEPQALVERRYQTARMSRNDSADKIKDAGAKVPFAMGNVFSVTWK